MGGTLLSSIILETVENSQNSTFSNPNVILLHYDYSLPGSIRLVSTDFCNLLTFGKDEGEDGS